jgi:hypothetical protein
MAKKTCPHCGALVDSNRSVCPNCHADIREKSSLTPYLIVAGIIGVIILIVAVILLLPAPKPAPLPAPQVTVPPAVAPVKSATPPCTIAVIGKKPSPAKIQLQIMTTTCFTGDITELSVSVNGEKKGNLGTSPGSSAMFDAASGTSNVIVAAKFSNGAESVVYQNAAL